MLRRIIEDFPMNTSLYHRNVLHEDIFQGFVFPLCSLYQVVQIVDVGFVVLAMMVVECLGAENFAKRILGVRQFGKAEGHPKKSFTIN